MTHSKTFDRQQSAAMVAERRQPALSRIAGSAQALRDMSARAAPPREMASAPAAPARGAKRLASEYALLPGGTRRYVGAHWEDADVFDKMCRDASARHVKAGGASEAFQTPFTPGQMEMARRYRDLTERHSAGGVKCASLEARGGGPGQGGEFIDAYITEGRELAAIHRRIGTGQAMIVRRIRPSARGSKASIMDRRLVDMVCLGGADLSGVLRAHGWACNGDHRNVLRVALCAALDRMQGYRD